MLAPVRSRAGITLAVAGVSLLGATALRFLFHEALGEHLSFSFFYLAVALTAWVGGIWPALATAFGSALIGNYFFTEPKASLMIQNSEELLGLLLFITVSAVIGVLSEISLRALERAKMAEKQKDEFMATVAHELRSPLSVIHYANALNRLTGSDSPDSVEIIDRQLRHLDLLIQDLLDISRITRGTIRLERQSVDASEIVHRALEKARPLLANREQQIEIQIDAQPIPIKVDPLRLEQVLANLLTNAAKYTPEGGRIDISVRAEGDSAVLTVRDTGIGIAEDMLPRVFEMFVQIESESPMAEGGLGIGLALVKKLVEMHGGSVEAYSEGEGQGSEFVVRLPLQEPASMREKLVTV